MVELLVAWDRYQPETGEVDAGYVGEVRTRLEDCRRSGVDVILSLGLQYPPDWAKELSGGVLRGSAGGRPEHAGAEVIFSADVRAAVQNYLENVVSDLGFDGITAIRLGTNATGELGYPGPDAGGNEEEFWAFGDAPQLGVGLAEGAVASPMPGWVPGTRSWRGKAVTVGQVQGWWDWYAGSVVNAVAWQAGQVRRLGYEGRIHVPVAGRGVLPSDKSRAAHGLLDGRANPDGAQERGLDYIEQFSILAKLPGVDIDFTGLDDVSDVQARTAVPAQDRCRLDDHKNVLTMDGSSWSSHRYTSALARRAGLGLVGENPGPPDSLFTGGSSQSDSLAKQLQAAPSYAVECGMTMFLFAFEENLFDGRGHDGSGVELADYRAVIQRLRPQ